MAVLPDAPRGIGQVLDSGFRLYFRSIRKVFLLALIGALINGVPGYWLMLWSGGLPLRRHPELLSTLPPDFLLLFAVAWLSSLLLYGIIIVRMHNIGIGRAARLGDEIAHAFRALAWLVIASILTALVVSVGFALLILPGIFLGVALAFYSYTILLDGKGPVGGMNYSYALVRGSWWHSATILTVALLIVVAIGFGVGLVQGVAGVMLGPQSHLSLQLLLRAVLNALLLPLAAALRLALYQDLKVRKQGADLEARIGDAATA